MMASSPRSVKHREMYKIRTPPWKETYRKRCMERLRGSREKLFSRFRNIEPDGADKGKEEFIKDLMTEEWKSLQRDKASGSSVDLMEFDLESFDMSEIDKMLNLFEDIQEELKEEETRLLQEYETYEHSLIREEEVLCSAIQTLSTDDDVVCPLCQKHMLMLNQGIVFCSCGLRINTEQDCLSLRNIKQQLQEGVSQHSSRCMDNPSFELMSGFGATNLLMTCKACDFMFVVI